MTAFLVFVAAGLSDLWDGHLARTRGLVTDLGKLLDPIADKLLLVATLLPFYIISHPSGGVSLRRVRAASPGSEGCFRSGSSW